MTLPRRHLLALAALALPLRQAHALEEAAATRMLFAQGEDGGRGSQMACSAFKPWPAADGVFVVVVPDGQDGMRVALMRAGTDGAPQIVAGPAEIEPITIDPIWTCLMDVDDLAPLGGRPVVAVRLHNSYLSTGRSSATESLHLLLRDGEALRVVFGSLLSASHSEVGPRGQRTGWQRRWRVVPVGGRPGGMPDLVVRDARSNATVSRHRWAGEAYRPPVFDRMPPLGPG